MTTTVEAQVDHGIATPTPTPTSLREIIAKAKARGFMGVVLVDQGGARPDRYLALCASRDGRICDPRCFRTHETPEAAIADLAERLDRLHGQQESKSPPIGDGSFGHYGSLMNGAVRCSWCNHRTPTDATPPATVLCGGCRRAVRIEGPDQPVTVKGGAS